MGAAQALARARLTSDHDDGVSIFVSTVERAAHDCERAEMLAKPLEHRVLHLRERLPASGKASDTTRWESAGSLNVRRMQRDSGAGRITAYVGSPLSHTQHAP
jgi:hypothetical protein